MTKKLLAAASIIPIVVLITEKGVYHSDGETVPVGKEIEVLTTDGKIPASLRNKCRLISTDEKPVEKDVPLTNPAKGKKKKKKGDDGEAKTFDDGNLAQIAGIGKSTAEALAEAGYATVSSLADASDDDLEALPPKLMANAIDWREKASELIAANTPAT